MTIDDLLKIIHPQQIELLLTDNIIFSSPKGYACNYRVVPIDDHLIICSPLFEFDTAKYVYLGEDSVIFKNLLQQNFDKGVQNALEIGCGTGFLSLWMSQFAQNVLSVDINPRAIHFTNLNADINGVYNISTQISNVYSNVQGKFDLIISNPPYVFLPDELTKRTFAFGGYLGIEILEKILLGLNEHLNYNGYCYLFFFSYIKNDGTDTAYELIKKLFSNQPYKLTLQQIDFHPLRIDPSFYKEHEISHAIRYFVQIQKSLSYHLNLLKINGIKKILESLKIKL